MSFLYLLNSIVTNTFSMCCGMEKKNNGKKPYLIHSLFNCGQGTKPLHASVFSPVKWVQ